jgi:hypothetical protein
MDNIVVKRQLLSFDDQVKFGFFGSDGWGREPITKKLEIPDNVIGIIFPFPEAELCVTLFTGDVAIGHAHANIWNNYLTQLPVNLNAIQNDFKEININKFVTLLRSVYQKGKELLVTFNNHKIVHRCGLMVLSSYSNMGLATMLIDKSDELLKEKGFDVAIVKTTNIYSRKTFEKNGYKLFFAFKLEEFQIPINDEYCILYKEL